MKLLSKILKTGAVLIIAVAALMFVASLVMRDRVAGIILKSLSNDITTKFEIGSVNLSFLKRFPKATLDLKNVLVHSSPGFDRKCFGNMDTDTLLSARSMTMEFSMTDIIKGIYNIERIGIREGNLKILTDTAGLVNYEITTEDTLSSDSDLIINLEGVNFADIKSLYDNRATQLIIAGVMENGRLKSKISGSDIDFTAKGDLRIDLFRLYNFSIAKNIETEVDVSLQSKNEGIRFDKSTLVFDNNKFIMNGFVSSDDVLDLSVDGENIDVSQIKSYLPEDLRDKLTAYDPSGALNVKSKIRGPLTRTSNPGIEISFSLEQGNVTYGNSSLAIKNMSFDGFFTNGSRMIPGTSSLRFSNFKGTLGSSAYTGSFTLSDFNSLDGDLKLKGKLIPSELKEFFNIKQISSAEGSVTMDMRMTGKIPKKGKYKIDDFLTFNTVADLSFNSFGIGLINDKIMLSNVTGNLAVAEKIIARDIIFRYKDQQINLNGTFVNLPEWLSGAPVILAVSASIKSDKIAAESFFPGSPDTTSVKERSFSLPRDMIVDLNFEIGDFIYKTYRAEDINGTMNYKPGILNFKTLNLKSLDGSISGDGYLVQNIDKSFIGKGTFDLEEINIKKAFTVFHNFGQDFLKDENLAGTLSGSLSVLIPMDSLFRPLIQSITAEGKYLIKNGALVNFEPVKELSDFIEISELENIRFEELENDFFIRNNSLYIPQMDVRSSAADLTINGKHGFDNKYEYHVKILLSDILSKKIPEPRPNTTEFGAVKDDGLGRTSLLLKIETRGDDIKVGYDVKAAGNQVKNEMKKERQSLKTILNEEYGWFKNDSAASEKPASGTPRFKVIWEETDTVKVRTEEPVPEKKDNLIKNLLKKIR